MNHEITWQQVAMTGINAAVTICTLIVGVAASYLALKREMEKKITEKIDLTQAESKVERQLINDKLTETERRVDSILKGEK